MPAYSRTRLLQNRNRQFTPYRPERYISPVPLRATASPQEQEALRKAGVPSLRISAFERDGAEYPETLPQLTQSSINIDDIAAQLAAGASATVAAVRLAKSTVADKFQLLIQTSVPDTFDLFRFSVEINGNPFIQEQFFTQPFQDLKEFYRKMDTETLIAVMMRLRPGAVIVPPLGLVVTQLYIDAYQGKFRG